MKNLDGIRGEIDKMAASLKIISAFLSAESPQDEQITTNFKMSEFTNGNTPTPEQAQNIRELAQNLQELHEEIQLPITITSGLRSPEQNQDAGGAAGSQHLYGRASDLQVPGRTSQWVAGVIERLIKEGRMKQGGMSPYANHVHYDTRGTRARW